MQKKPNNLKYFSLSKHLREESKSCQEFEVMLNNLTLEEIIGLKLEVAARSVNHRLYGLKIFNRIKKICKDAVVKYALCATKSKNEAALFLGISHKQLYYYLSTNDLIKKS
tara:strand:- start:204 stop:536 length:333 start_codon:yes stop_codon:yes gene_type:complete